MARQNSLVVYTVIIDRYDTLKEHVVWDPDVDYVVVTNTPGQHGKVESKYRVLEIDSFPDLDAARASRYPKILTHEFLADYDASMYIDGNRILTTGIRQFIEDSLQSRPLGCFFSSKKKCLAAELDACVRRRKDDPQTMREQVQGYFEEGYPRGKPVLGGAVMLRRHHDPRIVETMKIWWEEVNSKSKRDQLSLGYAVWKTGIPVQKLRQSTQLGMRLTTHGLQPRLKPLPQGDEAADAAIGLPVIRRDRDPSRVPNRRYKS